MTVLLEKIEGCFKNLPSNLSGGAVILSVGESILLVLDACEKGSVDNETLTYLKQLYLEGTKTAEDSAFIKEITTVLLTKNFTVKSDPRTINEDPTRRYFETSLAYHILQNNAESLNLSELEKLTQNLKQRLFSLPSMNAKERIRVEKILKGEMDSKILNKYELEYAELIHKLLKQDYHGLSAEACKNLYQIACNTILATLNTQFDKSMPVDVYSDSLFTMGMDGRGRVIKQQDGVKTTAKGLMKSTSPIPLYDDLVNPGIQINGKKECSPIQRSADQAVFMIESQWSQHLFSRQTQPYSNGISSTTLAQIRNIILQQRFGQVFDDSFKLYMTLFSSLMLYNSGGHSFFEIFEVFKLPLCHDLVSEPELSDALREDALMDKVLRLDQESAFERALQSTQSYTRILLNKKILNAQYKKNQQVTESTFGSMGGLYSIHNLVLHASAEEFQQVLSKYSINVNALNYNRWTPLMVAAQLGKNEHVQILLNAHADLKISAEDLSPLELAVKSQKFEIVKTLLNAGAAVKRKKWWWTGIRERAPALYLACRQNDVRILNAILDKGFNLRDKQEAILVALRIENIEAVKTLTSTITISERQNQLSGQYKVSLLKEAVALGNVDLIEEITNLVEPLPIDIDRNELLEIAIVKGYLPTVKYLLEMTGKPVDMNTALSLAVKHKHFDLAVILIVYGADPESISTSVNCLKLFNSYLQHTQHFDFFKTHDEIVRVGARQIAIQDILKVRKGDVLHIFLTNFIEFINRILPDALKLAYKDKTDVIENASKVLSNHSSDLSKLGLFKDSSDANNNLPVMSRLEQK